MKKLSMVLVPLFLTGLLFGKMPIDMSKAQVGAQFNANYYLAGLDDNDNDGLISPGFEGFFDYKLFDNLALNLSVGYNQVKIDYPTELVNHIIGAMAKAKFFPMQGEKFNPFVDVGIGAFTYTQDDGAFDDRWTSGMFTAGIGAEIALGDKFNLIPSVNFNVTTEDLDMPPNYDWIFDDEFLGFSLGLSYKLGGTKEVAAAPEPIAIEKPAEEPVQEKVVEEPVEEIEEPEMVEEVEEVVEETEVVEEVEVVSTQQEKIKYIVKKDDSLCKIARMAYDGDHTKWRDIYEWNKDLIGSNPNLIYPFYELELKDVPKENLKDISYNTYNYTVQRGESLRSIAAKEYGNPEGWLLILQDNKDVLGNRYSIIPPGTVLKLRDNLQNK